MRPTSVMKRIPIIILFLCLMMACESGSVTTADQNMKVPPVTLVIHGGAGTIRKENMSDEQQKAYHAALKQSLDAGYAVLADGGRSVDAIVAAITILEDSPLFNAG